MLTIEDIKQALIKLEELFGYSFRDLPLHIRNQPDVAYTTSGGIYISDRVRVDDLPIIIAHELFHHIFYDGSLKFEYNVDDLNIQWDYIINNYLKSNFDLDVSKCKPAGLLDNKNKTIYDRLDYCHKAENKFQQSFTNRQVLKLATQIAYKYKINRPSIYLDSLVEEWEFIDTISYDLKSCILPIDLYSTMRFIFRWLYQEEIIDISYLNSNNNKIAVSLTKEQKLGYTLPKWSRNFYKDPSNALLCAYLFLLNVQNHSAYLTYVKHNMESRLANMIDKLRQIKLDYKPKSKLYKRWVPYYEERIENLSYRIKHFSTKGADYYLPFGLQGFFTNKKFTPTLAHHEESSYDIMPKYKRTKFVKCANWCFLQATKEVDLTVDLYDQIVKFLKTIGVKEKEEESESGIDMDTDIEVRNCGNHKTANILTISKLKSVISNVLKIKGKFDSKLKLNRNKISDKSIIREGFTLGNDISEAVISELGLLGDELTKLEFYVKLANNAVFQNANKESRRLPVAIHIDCSGSMAGKRYELCLGYALALASILRKEDRGVVINLFSDTVQKSVVLDKTSTMKDFITLFAFSPSMGGTVIQSSFDKVSKIKLEKGWSSVCHLVMSDGEVGEEGLNWNRETGDLYYLLMVKSYSISDDITGWDGIWECSENNMRKIATHL